MSNTTIDPIKLEEILSKLKSYKIENVIMEDSSHGLKQNRLDGLKFNSGIFTNLSQDHLDYHTNLKNYLNAKLYLFKNLINKTIPCLQTLEGKLVKPHLNIINQKNNSNESIKSNSFGLYLINRVLI